MPKYLIRIMMALLLCAVFAGPGAAQTVPSGPLWTETINAKIPPDIARLNDHMNALAEKLKPALVQVRVRRAVEPQAEGEPPAAPEERERRSSGSGFLIRQDGYLITNEHVVADAEFIQVKLADGRRFEGRLIGRDERVDLALVKIEATGLPVAALGDSNRLRVGEFVLALGHPFGLEQTVSFGIVSRKGLPLQVATPGFDFIQTDATVNPGNSGGPLVNMAGEVIGINSMAARNGTIGFAIPVNIVKGLLPQLASKGKVEWGWLGVGIAEIADEDLPKYQLKEPRGVLIRHVVAGQPADKGGVKAEDVILAVDGAQIEGPRDLQRIIATTPVGRAVKLNVMRGGKETELQVTVGPYQTQTAAPGPQPRRAPVVPAPKPPAPAPK
ncbi:MAG TPA: trypsin-like peptidase domain-containing protein [Methylomirabilota bacterium]